MRVAFNPDRFSSVSFQEIKINKKNPFTLETLCIQAFEAGRGQILHLIATGKLNPNFKAIFDKSGEITEGSTEGVRINV